MNLNWSLVVLEIRVLVVGDVRADHSIRMSVWTKGCKSCSG